jgi:transposase
VTELFGVGPIVAATVLGEVRDVSRFADRDHFAAYNGTAPIGAFAPTAHRQIAVGPQRRIGRVAWLPNSS